MSRTIDEKVVEMQFDNKDFEKNAKATLSTLEKLKQSLNFDQVASKMEAAKSAIGKIKLFGGVDNQVEDVKVKFDGLRIFAERLVSNLADTFYKFGSNILKGMFGPLVQGGMDRALGIEQAKFQLRGLGVEWKQIEEDINYGVQDTAYGLDAAAKAASQLTASGVQMGDSMRKGLRAISGVAAMTNAQYEEISPIFTTIAGQGKMMTMQMRQLESRGLNVAASMSKSFNDILSGNEKAMSAFSDNTKEYVAQLTGGLQVSEADIREFVTQGKIDFAAFSEAMDYAFGEHAKDANNTFTGALGNMKFALKKIGAEIATIYMSNMTDVFNAIRPMINAIKEGLMPLISSSIDKDTGLYSLLYVLGQLAKTKAVEFFNRLTESIKSFTEKGGFRNLTDALANVLLAIFKLVQPIKKAFSDVFGTFNGPGVDGVVRFTELLVKLTRELLITDGVGDAIYSTFKGVFSVFKMGITIIGKVLGAIAPLIKLVFNVIVLLSGAITNIVTSFVDWINTARPLSRALNVILSALTLLVGGIIYGISALAEWISSLEVFNFIADKVSLAIDSIGKAVKNVVDWLKEVIDAARKLDISQFSKYLSDKIGGTLTSIYNNIKANHPIIYNMLNGIKIIIGVIGAAITGLFTIIKTVGSGIVHFISDMFKSIENGDFTAFLTKAKDRLVDFAKTISGLFSKGDNPKTIGEMLESLGNAIANFFGKLDASTVVAFVFSSAMIYLLINISKFTKALTGFVGILGDFVNQFVEKIDGLKAIFQSKIVQLTGFVVATCIALKVLADIPPEDLIRARETLLLFLAVMSALILTMTFIDKKVKVIEGAGVGNLTKVFVALSAMMLSISASMKILQSVYMGGKEILVKLGAVIAALSLMATIAVVMSKFAGDKKMLSATIAIAALAGGVLAISVAISKLSQLPLDNMKDNLTLLVTIMGLLSVLALSMGNVRLSGAIGVMIICMNIDMIISALEKLFTNNTFRSALASIADGISRFGDFVQNDWKKLAGIIGAMGVTTGLIVIEISELSKSVERIGKSFASIALGVLILIGTMALFDRLDISQEAIAVVSIMTALVGVISTFVTAFSRIEGDSKDIVGSKGKGAADTIKAITKFLLALGASMVLISAAMKIISTIPQTDANEFGRAIAAIGIVMLGVTQMIALLAFAQTSDVKTGPIVAAMAGIVIIIAEMVVLTTVAKNNMDELQQATIAIGVAMAAFAAIIGAMAFLAKESKDAKPGSIVAAMAGLTAAIVAIGYAVTSIARSTPFFRNIVASGSIVIAGMLVLTLILREVSKSSGLGNQNTAPRKAMLIAVVAGAIVAIGLSVSMIANSAKDFATLVASGATLILGMGVLLGMFAAIAKIKLEGDLIEKIILMASLTGVMVVLAITLGKLNSVVDDFKKFIAVGAVIGGAMLLFGTTIAIIAAASSISEADKLLATMGVMLAGAAMLLSIGAAMMMVAKLPWYEVLAALGVIEVVMITFTTVFAVIAVAFGVLAMTGVGDIAILGIIAVLAEFAMVMVSIGTAAVGFGIACTLIANGVVIVAQGLELLIPQLQLLIGMGGDLVSIGGGLVVLAVGVGALGAAGIILGLGAVGLILAAAGIAAIGLAIQFFDGVDLVPIAEGMIQVKESMSGMVAVGVQGIVAAVGIGAMAASLLLLGAAVSKSAEMMSNAMKLMYTVWETTTKLMQSNAMYVGFWITNSLALGMMSGIPAVVTAAVSVGTLIYEALTKATGVGSYSEIIGYIGEWISKSLAEGMANEAGTVATSGFSLGNISIDSIISGIQDKMPDLASTIGQVTSLIDGLTGSTSGYHTSKGGGGMPSDVAKQVDKLSGSRSGLSALQDIMGGSGGVNNLLKEMTGNLGDAAGGMDAFGDATSGAGGAAGSAKNAFQELTDTIRQQMDIFTEFNKGEEISGDQMLANMRSQVDGVAEWANNLQILAERGISQGLLQELGQLGPQGYAKVAAFVQMTDEQLQEANTLFSASLALPEWASANIVNSYAYAGTMAGVGFANGMNPKPGIDKATAMGRASLNALYSVLDIHSPSRKTYNVGQMAAIGLMYGIRDWTDSVVNMAESMATRVYNIIKTNLANNKFVQIGSDICDGLAAGIAANAYRPIAAAVSMAASAYAAAKAAIDSNSPSKKFMELGEYSSEGMAIGIANKEGLVVNAASQMGKDALESLRSSMSAISDIIDGRYEFDPVIKPQLDFTDLDKGFQEIDGMMQSRKIAVTGNVKESEENQNQQPSNYNFIQNNYSPKALPRVEIYRQTKNQFSQFRKAVEGV